jgi:hypothetical protein
MDFGEFLLGAISILSIFVAFPAIIINGIVRTKRAKAEAKGGADALRMSELQLLIEAAVEEATAPLQARVAALEEERLLLPPPPPLALDMPEEDRSRPAARAARTA